MNADAVPTDLPDRAAAVSSEIEAVQGELDAALLNGASTGGIRTRLAWLHSDAAAIASALDEAEAAREHEAAAAIEVRAAAVAAEAVGRLRATLAALRTPAAPSRRVA